MGSCVSVHKTPSGSAIKLVAFGSKREKLVIPASAIKDGTGPASGNGIPPMKSADRDFGSKEETFFDSQPWLESDCEDDFCSVNGDFTPSGGNSPVHHSFSKGNPNFISKPFLDDKPPSSITELSPTDNKKKLVELFKENLDEVQEETSVYQSNNVIAKTKMLELPARSAPTTPYVSGCSSLCNSERTINGDSVMEKEKRVKGCIPRLVSCSSFTERRRKMSPAIAVNDKA